MTSTGRTSRETARGERLLGDDPHAISAAPGLPCRHEHRSIRPTSPPTSRLIPGLQCLPGGTRQSRLPHLASLAVDRGDAEALILAEITYPRAHHLRGPQPVAQHQRQEGAVAEVGKLIAHGSCEERPDLLCREAAGGRVVTTGAERAEPLCRAVGPVALELQFAQEAAHSREAPVRGESGEADLLDVGTERDEIRAGESEQ